MVKPLTYVTVHDDDGEAHTFSPDEDLPGWAVGKIHNPNVLPDQDEKAPETPASQEPQPQPQVEQTSPPADGAPTKGNAGK